MTTQAENLTRVSERIGESIDKFAESCARTGSLTFHMDDLRKAVQRDVGKIAPDSAGRILRMKRAAKELNYRVLNRAASLYEFTPTIL